MMMSATRFLRKPGGATGGALLSLLALGACATWGTATPAAPIPLAAAIAPTDEQFGPSLLKESTPGTELDEQMMAPDTDLVESKDQWGRRRRRYIRRRRTFYDRRRRYLRRRRTFYDRRRRRRTFYDRRRRRRTVYDRRRRCGKGTFQNRSAQACLNCGSGQYQASSSHTATACNPHPTCTLGSTYQIVAPTLQQGRQCGAVNVCSVVEPTEFMKFAPTLLTGGTCDTHTICTDEQYVTKEATPTSDRLCDIKECTCSHGIGKHGAACATHLSPQCASCYAGYYLADQACAPYAGACDNGILVAQSERDHDNHCGECNAGYFLKKEKAALTPAPPTWTTIFTEAVGAANGAQFDNSDERTLNFPNAPSCTNSGNYWVKLEYNGGKVTTFKVPAGKDIFRQTTEDFEIGQVTSPMGGIGSTAKFCHACTKNGYRWGDTCWAVVPSGDNNRQCGCCSGGWTGSGMYYGGYKKQQVCGGQGGGFAGHKANGQSKGNLGSVGLTLSVSCGGTMPASSSRRLSIPTKTTCNAYAGTCANGSLVAQAERTKDGHCGACASGYTLFQKGCAKDCEVSKFSPWSTCSKSCGIGRHERRRTVVIAADEGGQKCPLLTVTQECNAHACPATPMARGATKAIVAAAVFAYDVVASPSALPYADAVRFCRALGRRLPVIETPQAAAALEAKCTELGYAADCTWLAVRCPAEDAATCADKHAWFLMNGDGQKTSALADNYVRKDLAGRNFFGGFPESAFATLPAGDYCMKTAPPSGSADFGVWEPASCAQPQRALCEKPASALALGARLVLPVGFDKITAMVADEAFIFATTYTGQLLKVNQLNLDDYGVMNFAQKTSIEKFSHLGALTADATHVFVTAADHAGDNVLLKIAKTTMKVDGIHKLTHADNIAYAVLERGDHVFLGLSTFPGKVIKVDKATMTLAGECTLSDGNNDVRSMVFDRTNPSVLFANTNTSPGRVVKVHVDTMTEVAHTELSMAGGQSMLLSGADQDDTHVVVGTATSPAHIVQLRKSDLATTASTTLQDTENMAIAIAADAQFTYAGLYTTPARVVRLWNGRLDEDQSLELPGSDKVTALVIPSSASGAGDKIYVGTDTSPAHIVEVVGALHASDCAISEWSHWSECSLTCGGGIQRRARSVIHPALHGGMACPADHSQQRLCNEHIVCPKECKDGMQWMAAALPRPTCHTRQPTITQTGVDMCACPPERPFWHNHGFCVTEAVCDVHVHSSICMHLRCAFVNNRVSISPVQGVKMQHQPFHCQHRHGRIGGCVCMCDAGSGSAAPTPAPVPCYVDAQKFAPAHQIGGLTAVVGSSTLCQAQCVATPDCRHWTFNFGAGECDLYGQLATVEAAAAPGYTSGPKVCPIDARVAGEFARAPDEL
jgi:hypothetical protein